MTIITLINNIVITIVICMTILVAMQIGVKTLNEEKRKNLKLENEFTKDLFKGIGDGLKSLFKMIDGFDIINKKETTIDTTVDKTIEL